MFTASAKAGCIAGGAGEKEIILASEYAQNIGLAFQVADDMLDITSDSVTLGKNAKSDLKNNKNTFVSILGGSLTDAYEYAKKLTDKALSNLGELKKTNKNINVKNLELLAEYLLDRKN